MVLSVIELRGVANSTIEEARLAIWHCLSSI